MIDLTLLRNYPEKIITALAKKDPAYDGNKLAELDGVVRTLKQQVEQLRAQKNDLARAGRGGVTTELRAQSIALGRELKEQEIRLQQFEQEFEQLYLAAPNIPRDDVPEGNKESNKVVKVVGKKLEFSFPIKNHLELAIALGWVNFPVAARIAASNFPLYQGDAVKLVYALGMMMLKNNMKHGYEPVLPCVLVNEKSLEVTGNFPKFREQVYAIPEDHLFLTPTAEVNIANMYREHIFMADELPIRLTAWTSCFRREAGGYGAHERGLIRIHQFEKVELYTFSQPEQSDGELDRMIACAEDILKALGLQYRIVLLAGQDCSFASAKTYDIELWSPGQNTWIEVASCSNCTDFQARRGLIRYRRTADDKTHLVHTLNASSLALPRLIVALMETYQQPDGTIRIPEILKKEGIF